MESLTSGSGAKSDHLGFGQIDSELPLLAIAICKALSCRCSLAGVVDTMVRSSGYSRNGVSAPEREGASGCNAMQCKMLLLQLWSTALVAEQISVTDELAGATAGLICN